MTGRPLLFAVSLVSLNAALLASASAETCVTGVNPTFVNAVSGVSGQPGATVVTSVNPTFANAVAGVQTTQRPFLTGASLTTTAGNAVTNVSATTTPITAFTNPNPTTVIVPALTSPASPTNTFFQNGGSDVVSP